MATLQKVIKPQEGYQTKVCSSPADIIISGAMAGVGKTFVLLLDPLRDIHVDGFGGVIFRRTSTQIRNEGGLWDTSMTVYPYANGVPKESVLEWEFPNRNRIRFRHIEHEKNIFDWQGAQIPFIGFDELTHFSRKMFFYLLSRSRSTCGVKPYVRATCNPDPESWVASFISWWINEDTGFAIPERDGVIRYLIVDGEKDIWGDTEEEVIQKAWYLLEPLVEESGLDAKNFVKSVTFISGSIYQNKELLSVNPSYLSNLLSQDEATKAALLHGNWKTVLNDKDLYNYSDFVGMFHNVVDLKTKERFITADIALKGSNKFIVLVWEGFEVVDVSVVDISDGKKVIDVITLLARKWGVPNNKICYDNDGVGGFVDGFLVGALPFNNGGAVVEVLDENSGKLVKENYKNLKNQCYYRSADRVNRGGIKVSEYVANKMYDDKSTIKQRFIYERKAIKRDKADDDGKLCIISKAEMKTMLDGDSPDLMDALMMREYFDLAPKINWEQWREIMKS